MAGETLFKRKCSLIVAKPLAEDFQNLSAQVTKIEDMRVSFDITKSITKEANEAEIKIYNLSESTRSAITAKGAKVVLQAGYQDTLAQIFIGDARQVKHKQEGVDWVSTITCGDGARAMQFARVSESFAGGTQSAQVIKRIAEVAKIDIGNLDTILPDIDGEFTQGYAVHGIAFVELEKLLKVAGYTLSVQDGALLAVTDTSTSTETVLILNRESGLIGSPQMSSEDKKDKKPVLTVRSLLQPDLKPGRRVRLRSAQYNGDFRVEKVKHTGDTNGSDWYSDLELGVI
jgi:hypothetical protein